MRVLLTREAIAAPGALLGRLPGLLDSAIEGRHDILVESPARDAWDQWLGMMGDPYRSIYARAVADSHTRQAVRWSDGEVSVGAPERSDWAQSPPLLTIEDAAKLLGFALEVLVEDETSDGLFLDAVVPPCIRAVWGAAREKTWIRLVTAGGVPNVTRRLEGERKKPAWQLRTFVIIDSDSPRPWRVPDVEAARCWRHLPDATKKVAHEVRRLRFRLWVLERRMAENYIPPAALRIWLEGRQHGERVTKGPHVAAFEQLPRERQHHHHLKRGLSGEEQEYDAVAPENVEALRFALGDRLFEAFKHAGEQALEEYGVYDELTPLFNQLVRMM